MNPVHHNVRTVLFAPKGCASLFAADSGGTSDPYVVVRPNRLPKEGSEPHKTTTKKKVFLTFPLFRSLFISSLMFFNRP